MSDQSPPQFEYQKWTHELKLRDAERAHDSTTDFAAKTNAAALDNANLAMRTAVLINGGAAVSVLAFIGGLNSQARVPLASLIPIAASLVWFAVGVAAATFAMGCAYLTNYSIAGDVVHRKKQWEHPYILPTVRSRAWRCAAILFQWVAIIGALASLVLFVYGVIEIKNAIGHLP
jgi:hypothetical protein